MSDRSDILLTLFNTLTKAFERTEKANERLATQQGDLVTHIKNLKLDEIKSELKDHGTESSKEIGTCTDEVKAVDTKVSKMITVVITLVTLFSIAVLIASTIVYFGTKKQQTKSFDPIVLEEIINKSIMEHEKREAKRLKDIQNEIDKRHRENTTTE